MTLYKKKKKSDGKRIEKIQKIVKLYILKYRNGKNREIKI